MSLNPFALIEQPSIYEPPTSWSIVQWATDMYHHFFLRMVAKLYIHGPRLGGYGFWASKPAFAICAELHQNPSGEAFWTTNEAARLECYHIIELHFRSLVVTIEFIIQMFLLFHVLRLTYNNITSFPRNVYRLIHWAWNRPRTTQHQIQHDPNMILFTPQQHSDPFEPSSLPCDLILSPTHYKNNSMLHNRFLFTTGGKKRKIK
jgi:hypothetical protein